MKLLLIHPDPAVLRTGEMEKEGFIIEQATTLSEAAGRAAVYYYDVIITFVHEPDEVLMDFIASVTDDTPRTGVIVVSDEVSVEQKIKTLAAGADDYMVRPVNRSELRARVFNLIRRCSMGGLKEITHEDIRIEPATRKVSCCGTPVRLTRKEYELLFFFLRNPEKILTHEMIAEYLWGDIKSLSADCFDFIYSHVKNVRKKLFKAGGKQVIDTVYGVGYVFR